MNETALITGASSGIGAAFAEALAGRGFDLVLTARRSRRIEELARRLNRTYRIRIETIPADLNLVRDVKMLERVFATHGVTWLINNAGFGLRGSFDQIPIENILRMADVHMTAVLRLTRAAIPVMRDRGHGVIIQVASMAAFTPSPGSGIYSATKAFLVSFSETLAKDLRGTGIKVQALCPGLTVTEFHNTPEYKEFRRDRVPKILWMSAEKVVKLSLQAVHSNKTIVVPGWINRLFLILIRIPGVAALVWRVFEHRKRKIFRSGA
ncbi:MAG: SDR family NAD(P)-dependent oxidoreductase [Candidatus Omnitrophota bacterium]